MEEIEKGSLKIPKECDEGTTGQGNQGNQADQGGHRNDDRWGHRAAKDYTWLGRLGNPRSGHLGTLLRLLHRNCHSKQKTTAKQSGQQQY